MKWIVAKRRQIIVGVAPHWGAWIEIPCRAAVDAPVRSHPTGVRGLKYLRKRFGLAHFASHPTGVRGLKYSVRRICQRPLHVAPHWGAWTEIMLLMSIPLGTYVAPHWGAWIEIVILTI